MAVSAWRYQADYDLDVPEVLQHHPYLNEYDLALQTTVQGELVIEEEDEELAQEFEQAICSSSSGIISLSSSSSSSASSSLIYPRVGLRLKTKRK